MDQDATWYGGNCKPWPRRRCVRWGRSSPKRGTATPPPGFRFMSILWPNGLMDEGATWYGSRRQPGHIVLDRDPPPQSPGERNTAAPLSSAHIYCGDGRPSGVFIHPAVSPRKKWADNWGGGSAPFGEGARSPSNTKSTGQGCRRDLPLYQVAS